MFTGIIGSVGRTASGSRSCIAIESAIDDLREGESIAVNGVCLTVVSPDGGRFEADISEETLKRTSLGDLRSGDFVNLERALRLSDRLGGHFVQGHVDATGQISAIDPIAASTRMTISYPAQVAKYIVEKGSIAVDGVSLTVSEQNGDDFVVDLVPHTMEHTSLGRKEAGDRVNLEVDILAKYIERSLQTQAQERETAK